jgi:hypothetical protein
MPLPAMIACERFASVVRRVIEVDERGNDVVQLDLALSTFATPLGPRPHHPLTFASTVTVSAPRAARSMIAAVPAQ